MKNAVTYLFIVFLASLIFYGGAGVNLITYCCGDCRTEGVAVLLNDTCCDVHEHNCCSTADEVSACDSGCCEEDCCDMERISFDWSSSNNPIVELQPAVTDLLSFASPLASLVGLSACLPVFAYFTFDLDHPDNLSVMSQLCHAVGNTLPCSWQNSANTMAEQCQYDGKALPCLWQNLLLRIM